LEQVDRPSLDGKYQPAASRQHIFDAILTNFILVSI